jgi:PRTRC genetic system protein E
MPELPQNQSQQEKEHMFIELMPILKNRVVMITASDIGDGFLRVNVIPKALGTNENPALATPLTITGKPEDLDRDLATQLASFSESVTQASSNLETLKAEHAAAIKTVEAENKKKLDERKKTSGAKNGALPVGTKEAIAPDVEVKEGKSVFGSKTQQASPRTPGLFDAPEEIAAATTPQAPSVFAPLVSEPSVPCETRSEWLPG